MADGIEIRQAMAMNALDLKGPPPQPKTLGEAQQVIAALWAALGELRERIEQLEEQIRTDSGNSSKAPSSDFRRGLRFIPSPPNVLPVSERRPHFPAVPSGS